MSSARKFLLVEVVRPLLGNSSVASIGGNTTIAVASGSAGVTEYYPNLDNAGLVFRAGQVCDAVHLDVAFAVPADSSHSERRLGAALSSNDILVVPAPVRSWRASAPSKPGCSIVTRKITPGDFGGSMPPFAFVLDDTRSDRMETITARHFVNSIPHKSRLWHPNKRARSETTSDNFDLQVTSIPLQGAEMFVAPDEGSTYFEVKTERSSALISFYAAGGAEEIIRQQIVGSPYTLRSSRHVFCLDDGQGIGHVEVRGVLDLFMAEDSKVQVKELGWRREGCEPSFEEEARLLPFFQKESMPSS